MKEPVLPIIGGSGWRGPKLDEKLCFELWVDRGTALKASLALVNEFNTINPKTNKPYTQESVNKAAKRYVLEYPDKARELWESKYGEVRNDLWYDFLSRISKLLITTSSTEKYYAWLDKHPEVVEYEKSREG